MPERRHFVLTVLFVVAMRLIAQSGVSQAIASQSGDPNAQRKQPVPSSWDAAGNRWRYEPVDITAQVDPVPHELRQTRNAYWSNVLYPYLIWESQGKHLMMPDESALRRELFPDPAGKVAWALVTFDSYTVVPLDPKLLTMYTELHFTIEKVLRQQKSILLNPNDRVDADLPGGSVKTPAGESRSFDLSPQVYFVETGHEYLVTLEYEDPGAFYRLGNFLEVKNGIIASSSVGTSKLVGHTVDDAASQIEAINSAP